MFQGLLQASPSVGNYPYGVAGMAEGYAVNPTYDEWIFALRRDARWSDGMPVIAKDFRHGWCRSLDRANGSALAKQLFGIKGARAFYEGAASNCDAVGIHVVDDHTLKVVMGQPDPLLARKVRGAAFWPLPAHKEEPWSTPEKLVVNGPYHIAESQHDQFVRLRRNPHYWGQVPIGGVEVKMHGGQIETVLQWYAVGVVDWVKEIPGDRIGPLKEQYGEDQIVEAPSAAIHSMAFRIDRTPFRDARIRRQMCAAIDRRELVGVVGGGRKSAASFIHPTIAGVDGYAPPANQVFHDPFARQGLGSDVGGPLTYIFNKNVFYGVMAEDLQGQFKKAGLEVVLENQEVGTWRQNIGTGQFQLSRFGWYPDYLDIVAYLDPFETGHEVNVAGYSNPEFDAKLRAIRRQLPGPERNTLVAEAEAILLRDMPMCPLMFDTQLGLLKPSVNGLVTDLGGSPLVHFMQKEPAEQE